MKNVRELETCGAILIGCGIMAYTLMLASVDAPVWATIEFVMGTLFILKSLLPRGGSVAVPLAVYKYSRPAY